MMGAWYWFEDAENADPIALFSIARRIRNIDGLPFPVRLKPDEKDALNRRIAAALSQFDGSLTATSMRLLYPYQTAALAERFTVSPGFAAATEGTALITSENEDLSIMLGDEDHVRLQAVAPGLQPEAALQRTAPYDAFLNRTFRFAFDSKLGYLNRSPANIGTGMRASVVLHLPALSRAGALPALSSAVASLGLSIKGAYGDGLSVKGDLYRISNKLTMGISEEEAVGNLKSMCLQLATKERRTAETLAADIRLRDRIQRASSVLAGAVLLTTNEALELLSLIRFGALYGQCDFDLSAVNMLLITVQPANINCLVGARLSASERDELRAKLVRKKLFPAEDAQKE